MQLHQLIQDTRSSNPKTPDETMNEYLDRTYYLALLMWESVPESDKQADDDAPPPLPIEPTSHVEDSTPEVVVEDRPLESDVEGK